MAESEYAELHCHSHWSLLEGASSVEELVLRAWELGYDALALTDHDGLHGAMEFAQTAWAFGVRPIIGAEVTLANGYHLTLLCETQEGYANLCRLISHALLNSPRGQPALNPAVLARHARGLIALSGCKKGEVPSLVAAGRYKDAEAAARHYIRIFGRDSFFIELQQNLVYGDTSRIRALVRLAKRLKLGYVATNNVHYHLRERHRLQDVLVAIKNRTTLDASNPQWGAFFGWSVAVGDVNSDGKEDIAVGAPFDDVGGNDWQGRAYVFSRADGSLLQTLNTPNPQRGAQFGWRLAVGDVNGDGKGDIAVGAHEEHVGGNEKQGRAYVFSGADGSLLLSLDTPNPQWHARFGSSVATGDVNRDGKADITVGAPFEDVGSNLGGAGLRLFVRPRPRRRWSGQRRGQLS